MSHPAVERWGPDALLREAVEQDGWRGWVIATRDGRLVARPTFRELYLAVREKAK
jgi:hypothetical protein